MTRQPKSAEAWQKELTAEERRKKRIEKAMKNPPKISIEDLRDETMAIVRKSGLTYDEIHAKFGASGTTLTKWNYKETLRPQLNTIRGTLRACGFDLVIAPQKVVPIRLR
jgi:hypothetical protein